MQKINLKNKTLRFSLISLVILLFLEVFVFNFNSFRLIGGNYEQADLDLSTAHTLNFERDENTGTLSLPADEQITNGTIEIHNINQPIKTISFHIEEMADIENATVGIEFSDATVYRYSSLRRNNISIDLIKDNERSHTSVLQLSGEVGSLRMNFSIPRSKGSLVISGISINQPVSFHFSVIRLLVLFGFLIGIYLLLNSKALKKPFSENNYQITRIVIIITTILLLFTIILSINNAGFSVFKQTQGNQMTQELVDAFRAGQVHLLTEPSEEILNLENPYDGVQRAYAGAEYLWDHCLYEGKYYSYYGIAPVVLLFLPYNIMTDYYFPSNIAVMIFSMAGIIFLSMLFLEIIKRWFKKLPGSFVIMGLLMLQFSSGIFFSVVRPKFYEIAISAGFAAVLVGAFFLITSNVVGRGKLSLARLSLSSVFFSLAVLSRPTLAVYCVCALIFLFFGLEKLKGENGKLKKKSTMKYLVASLLPYAIFGSVQLLYNYLRFDNPLDFGIQYSLTINDFTNSQFDIHFVMVLLFAYLLNSPMLVPEFPFVSSSFHRLNMNGFMYIDYGNMNTNSIGIFFRALPMFSYFLAPKAYRLLEKPKKAATLIGSSCLVAPLIIIAAAWESGYAIRYNADISWQMLIGALLIFFVIYEHMKSREMKNLALYAMVFSTVMCFIINFAQNYNFLYTISSFEGKAFFLSLERIFEFWR